MSMSAGSSTRGPMPLERNGELERARNDVARRPGGTERLGAADPAPIEGEGGRQSHALVVPGRLRIPLIQEIEIVRADAAREGQLQIRVTLDLLGQRGVEQ